MFMLRRPYKNKELFDFRNYSKDSSYYNNLNNLVIGKMKDETFGICKCKKAKGININLVDDEMKYKDYKNVLFNRSFMRYEMNRIQSKDHNIGTYRINKISLPCYSDKKHILKDGYSRLSHFLK